jgi:hypothetical protein
VESGSGPEPLPPLVRAIQDFHAGRAEAAVESLSSFDKPNQELLLQLMPALVRVSQMSLTLPDPEEAMTLARTFESAAATLTKRAGMTIKKAVLCLDVKGYGKYTPVRDRNDLRRGEVYWLYVEVGNVPCDPETRGAVEGFLTRLDVSMQVKDDLGKVIQIVDQKTGQEGPRSTSEKAEFSRSPIHDYFVVAKVPAPDRSGVYTVTIELRDPKSGRVVSRPVPFRVQ